VRAFQEGRAFVDSTRPPQVVLEPAVPCADAAAVQVELDKVLARARAPGPDWKVRARFEAATGHVTVYGEVVDAEGHPVASRTLSTGGTSCASLAKGLGVWASLVLDAEVDRARPASSPASLAEDPLAAPPAARSTESLWPTARPPEPRSPEADMFLEHTKQERTVELGLESFVMGGTGGGAIVGPAAFGVFEAAHGFFLRPSILVGHSIETGSEETPATFLASRFDACARLPGMYRQGRGLQLDLCGGAEVGFSIVDSGLIANSPPGSSSNTTLPFLAVGPSFGLRGELGSSLSAVVRGVADISFLRDVVSFGDAQVTPSILVGRAEVGLSWALR